MARTSWLKAFFLSVCFILPAFASAQAWVPDKGEGTVTLTLQDNFVKKHLGSSGERLDVGHIRTFVLLQDIDFGITNKLAVDINIPFVRSKYYGPRPHQLPVDDGNYHNNFQDVRMSLRYNLRTHPFMITPFVALGLPSNDYIYFAHSAAGTAQREYVIGCSFLRDLEGTLPRSYVQGSYLFLVPQEVMGIRTYRSRVDMDVGHFVTNRVSIRALSNLQIGHAGYGVGHSLTDGGDFPVRKPSNIMWYHHDQTSRISYLNIGGSTSIGISKSWSAFLALFTTVWGRNGHALNLGEVVGLSWTYRTPWAKPQAVADPLEGADPTNPTKAPTHVH
jgi:hypothetical protein